MNLEKKGKALAAWRLLAKSSDVHFSVEVKYDALLKMANEMESEHLITSDEWRQLVRDAGAVLHAKAGGGG